ncbi:hypothetical protein ACQBAU_09675 [Propionibacteriaceae bacterium Y2011]|uniref:hypothetical protein n=1 Tax=Microlunatus sp. Y2014 TaxID=3418488 RepID=UPI003B4CA047
MITIYFVAADAQSAERAVGGGPQGEDTVESEVDPTALAWLDAQLTGRDLDDLLGEDLTTADGSDAAMVGRSGGAYVVALDPLFTTELARADVDELLPTWLESDDVDGADPEDMSDFLTDLQTLCADAADAGHRVYCWVGA